jgi:hypothetical protein
MRSAPSCKTNQMALTLGDTPEPFGYKMAWLAVRSTDVHSVANSLPLTDIKGAGWKEGVNTVYERYTEECLFLTPPMEGWVLVVGLWAEGIGSRPETLISLLSEQFEDVQAFATHRVQEYHHWMWARNGVLLRSYAYLGSEGRVLADYGGPTQAEIDLGYKKWPTDQEYEVAAALHPSDDDDFRDAFWWMPNESTVMKIAGKWSVDPSSLGPEIKTTQKGLLATTLEPPLRGNIAPSIEE